MSSRKKVTIGFIGQGFVGKSYADDFERRGFAVTRYALEEPYVRNKEKIRDCDFVFIAVPTPTTPKGFDSSILEKTLPLVGKGKVAVIKSTVLPGTTERLQKKFSRITVLFSPEFLLESSAARDASGPIMNIVGIPSASKSYRVIAQRLMSLLPQSPFEQICGAREAELFKYAHNVHGFFRVIFSNLIYDLARASRSDFGKIVEAMNADPYMTSQASYYNRPVHKGGRGAGGHCYIKDFAAFREMYEKNVKDSSGVLVLRALEKKNIDLLCASKKDLDLLEGVYGKKVAGSRRRRS